MTIAGHHDGLTLLTCCGPYIINLSHCLSERLWCSQKSQLGEPLGPRHSCAGGALRALAVRHHRNIPAARLPCSPKNGVLKMSPGLNLDQALNQILVPKLLVCLGLLCPPPTSFRALMTTSHSRSCWSALVAAGIHSKTPTTHH